MTDLQALQLHSEDEVTIKANGAVTTVLQSFCDENNQVAIETAYNGFTTFRPDEIK